MSRHDQELEDYIRDGMARMLWVHAYMIWATEVDPAPVLSPGTWDENAPDTASSRRASLQAAGDLADMFRNANRLGVRPMAELFAAASAGYGLPRSHATRSTEGDYAYAFGRALAGICLGTTDPGDSVLPLSSDLVVPSFHVDLDDDGQELTWEGRTDGEPRAWERNPHGNPGEEVLLIEDEPTHQRSTTRMIKKVFPGAEVIVADNADAAIANLQHHQFVHVVSDVDILGPKSGIDVFRWVQHHQPQMVGRYTFLTGNSAAEEVHDRVIMKPAGFAEFRDGIMRGAPTVAAPVRTMSPPPRATSTSAQPLSSRRVAEAVYGVMPLISEEPGDRGRPRGRYGRSKVFVAALWRRLQQTRQFQGVTEDQFKKLLVTANRERSLSLARADLVGAMDPTEVRQSEISDMGAEFHFVLDPTAKEPWE